MILRARLLGAAEVRFVAGRFVQIDERVRDEA